MLKVLCLLTFTCDASNLTVCIESLLDDDDEHEVDTIGQEDAEFLLSEHIDNMSDKNARNRESALFAVQKSLMQKMLSDFLEDRKETLLHSIEFCLKKAKPSDIMLAAPVAALLCIQLGAGEESEEVLTTIRPQLSAFIQDKRLASSVRANCSSSLALITFISCEDISLTSEVMGLLEQLFTPNGTSTDLQARALTSWCLLLSIVPESSFETVIERVLPIVIKLLDSSEVSLRIAAGEAVALLYELARGNSQDFEPDIEGELIDRLQSLARDSSKYRSKKDKKQQRSCFRDVLRTVEEGECPYETCKFGTELLELDSWVRIKQYGAFREALGSGVNLHLQENSLLREVFDLGPPPTGQLVQKLSKRERRYVNAMADKARTQARSKNRDKRTV